MGEQFKAGVVWFVTIKKKYMIKGADFFAPKFKPHSIGTGFSEESGVERRDSPLESALKWKKWSQRSCIEMKRTLTFDGEKRKKRD